MNLTSKNARKALELARRTDTPVYAGAAAPLLRPLVTAEQVHGRTGFDGYDLPEPSDASCRRIRARRDRRPSDEQAAR